MPNDTFHEKNFKASIEHKLHKMKQIKYLKTVLVIGDQCKAKLLYTYNIVI